MPYCEFSLLEILSGEKDQWTSFLEGGLLDGCRAGPHHIPLLHDLSLPSGQKPSFLKLCAGHAPEQQGPLRVALAYKCVGEPGTLRAEEEGFGGPV